MKIALVSTFDIFGGAARAAHRLHCALLQSGIASTMVVMQRYSEDETVTSLNTNGIWYLAKAWDHLHRQWLLRPYRKSIPAGFEAFNIDQAMMSVQLARRLPRIDLINLHWVSGLLDYQRLPELILAHGPVVWTLHDMLPLTGGCHYDHECGRFVMGCGRCPQLGSVDDHDLSRQSLRRKQVAFSRIPDEHLHFVTPSRWLAEEVRRSPILRRFGVTVIPNSFDTERFVPTERSEARASLQLPQDKRIVLFMAQDVRNRRKGMSLLVEALRGVTSGIDELLLVSVGHAEFPVPNEFAYRHLPHIDDDRILASVFSAADLLVIPSLQDNLPNTMLESMACGTPVLGFDVGGIPDLVRHGETGLLAPAGDVEGLRRMIEFALRNPIKLKEIGHAGREAVLRESQPAIQAARYSDVFSKVLRAAESCQPTAERVRA